MDLDLVVLAGKMAAEPELREFESGTRLLRTLVTVRAEKPTRRIDVLPVVLWDPDDDLVAEMTAEGPVRGRPVWVAGSVQRRFWSEGEGRISRVEIVAHDMKLRALDRSENDET